MVRKLSQRSSSSGWGSLYPGYSTQKSSGIASIRYLPNGVMLQLEVPYHKEFNEMLKSSIVYKKRIYDANDKCWYIVRDQLDKLCHILDKYYSETILLDFPMAETSTGAYSKLFLLDGAPLDLVRTAYRTLAKIYHTDKPTGDKAKMQDINAAYKELMGEFVNGDSDEKGD